MKILEINTEKEWRGGERQTFYLLKGLKEAGLKVELLCLKKSFILKKSEVLNIPIHIVESNNKALIYLIKHGKNFDILHTQTAKAQTIAILTKKFHKRPVVYTRRVSFLPKGRLTKLKYRLTDKVIAVSIAIKNILTNFGINNIEVIPDVAIKKELDRKKGEILKKSLKIENKKIIATISALTPEKDPFTMIKTIKNLSKIRNDFIFLHFGEGKLKKDIKKKLKKYNIKNIYKLLGFYNNIEDYYCIFDIFVMSSKEEGLGSSVLDAFLYKVPVVSTDAAGLKETVFKRGLLCPIGDYRCLANSINKLLEDTRLRCMLVKKAYKDVIKYYSMEKIIENYIKVFQSMFQKNNCI